MTDPVEVHRKEVAQRILTARAEGGWEGTHTDFKRQLGATPRDLSKLLKHLLAFANTPRRTDAYIIFGVDQDKANRLFTHVGVLPDGFPSPEQIYQYVHDHTHLEGVIVDDCYTVADKRTPYIAIPLQYDGPYALRNALPGLGATEVFCRYGSRSVRATERDVHRMRCDWNAWFLDCRYEKNASSLATALARRFPHHRDLTDTGDYVRLVYDGTSHDEFGTHVAPVLVHAYWGFDPVEPMAIDRIRRDTTEPAVQRIVIGPRFELATLEAAAPTVRCVPLDEIYFVNDAYAQVCRDFLRTWAAERDSRGLDCVIDLDVQVAGPGGTPERRQSVLFFLEEQLKRPGRAAVVVHGNFGCGKTTTAKHLVAELCEDYLRGRTDVPRVLYLDVNSIDIRARRDECIEGQLRRLRLSQEHVDSLINDVLADNIQLVFDGVDEMARPYTAAGRRDAIEILRDIGNRRAAAYFVRSSYYPELKEMIADFGRLADFDFSQGEKRMVVAAILGLRQEQVTAYLESRLGSEDARIVRSSLARLDLTSFLADPLITSLVADLAEEEGSGIIASFPHQGLKARFLSYLIAKLLDRELEKRRRHGGLVDDPALFQRILRSVAFSMVCRGLSAIQHGQLEAFVCHTLQMATGNAAQTLPAEGEVVNAFRTMAWLHRSEDGTWAFRHQGLTLVCAAQHACAAVKDGNSLDLADWQEGAPLADIVCEYAGETIDTKGLLGATAMLGGELPFNVRQLVRAILDAAGTRLDLRTLQAIDVDDRTIVSVCLGIVREPRVARAGSSALFLCLGDRRDMQVRLPLLYLLSRSDASEAFDAAVHLLKPKAEQRGDLCDDLRSVKEDPSNALDVIVLKGLGVSAAHLVDATHYRTLFGRICERKALDRPLRQYAERTLRGIEGEIQRREAAIGKVRARRPGKH